ncbi:MAG: outer membrane protein assembly factor BamD [Chlamydiales bacterium]|nr:outer membrane protein assembly factor BamD [Chlamydiales bacterium]
MRLTTLLLILFLFQPFAGHTTYLLKEGRLVPEEEAATMSVQEHYSAAMTAYQKKKWDELVKQAIIVTKNFPDSPFAQEALFYLGVGYFNQKEYELANEEFSTYLKKQTTPKHFEEAIEYKFAIAEMFQKGARKHLMGWKSMPKWVPAREEALAIYDEVITALPHHDLGAKALYGKAKLLLKDEDYKVCIETYQTLIRRFPKNALAAQSYLGIGEVYLTQCENQYPDPDFLDLAEINLRKFKLDFPQNEQVEQAEEMLAKMQEIYAKNLFETAQFFERTKKIDASIIYYKKIVASYPSTRCAELSQQRLHKLQPKPPVEALQAEGS